MTQIICVYSHRRGVGKTHIAANLAAQLALKNKRVAVVDVNFEFPGLHMLFGFDNSKGTHTMLEYLNGKCAVGDIAFPVGHSALAGKHLWLLPSCIQAGEITNTLKSGCDPAIFDTGLQALGVELNLDFLILDTSAGFNEQSLMFIALADILTIVLHPVQHDFQNTAVTVDISGVLDVPSTYLIVNNALARYDFNQVKREVERVYHIPVLGILPFNEELAALGSSGLFSLGQPKHPWSKGIIQIAEKVY